MTNEDLQKLKRHYANLKKIKNNILSIQEKLSELENDPKVKKYLKLQGKLKTYQYFSELEKKSDNELIKQALDGVKITETNHIYVYMGTFMENTECDVVHGRDSDYEVAYENPNADYRRYANIELNYADLEQVKKVSVSECEKFEEENTVLYPPKDMDNIVYYNAVRDIYFENVIKHGEKKALEKVFYKRHIQRINRKKLEEKKES